MRDLTKADFDSLWPQGAKALIQGILATQGAVGPGGGVTKALRLAHLMAQISHESGGGTSVVESLDYSPRALLAQWPAHFTAARAQQLGRTTAHPADQRMIADLAYGGRMGNAKPPSDDGWNFRGRGLLQITGRDGYLAVGKRCGLDLIRHPDLIVDPAHAFRIAADEFRASGCLPYCDKDDVVAVSGLVNCGQVVPAEKIDGLSSRTAWLGKWKARLGI